MSGIRAAQNAGKWTGRAPRGFYVDEKTSVLHVDDTEFLNVRVALERVVDGEPVTTVAESSGIPESTLRRLRDDRLELYFEGDAADDRVDQALDDVRPLPEIDVDQDEDELADRVAALEKALQNQ